MFQRTVSVFFRLSTIVFLIGGLAIVVGQGVGLVLGDGNVVNAVSATLSPYVYGCAGVAGLLAFVMSYGATGESDDAAEEPASPAASPNSIPNP